MSLAVMRAAENHFLSEGSCQLSRRESIVNNHVEGHDEEREQDHE